MFSVARLKMLCFFVFIVFCLSVASCQMSEGDSCIKEGVHGTCTKINKCPPAVLDIRNRRYPQICSFTGVDPVVCCVGSTDPEPATRPGPPPPVPTQTITEHIQPDYETNNSQCVPLYPSFTSAKTGQKAWDKCIEYQEKIIYPCEKSLTVKGGMNRRDNCHRDELIGGRLGAVNGEFPHNVVLGFGNDSDTAQWLCSGALVSEWYILTSGQCTLHIEFGPVTYAALEIVNRTNILKSNVYKIKRIIRHPEYKRPSKYNDIALLQTETEMSLSLYAVPACLDVGKEPRYDRAVVTGWGTDAYRGNVAETLQKITLNKFAEDVCPVKITETRLMRRGFDASTQLCYGDFANTKDSCNVNSGGLLQVKNEHVKCMHTVVGVTSFWRPCDTPAEPGIFTKVQPYVPWIESVVWA